MEKPSGWEEGIVRSLATMGEMSGLYPRGHPERVARLSCALASEMDFPQTEITALQVMGILHDIGKAVVPKEILSKPVALNALEKQILQSHPQAGYEIIKEIAFPSPVALAVLQHHEKINGSGYPQGLSGEDFIREARILAVAESVEDMASCQLHRPAIGLEAALQEIEKNKGILYDAEIAEACLLLFREKGFKLEV
ncbi:MAG: HD domain-containing phosphohydrolase [Thermodesulfobacteriota bacterium]